MKCEVCKDAEGGMVEYGILFYMLCDDCADRIENLGTTPLIILSAFSYLDELRESTRTNMLNGSQYLMDEWGPDYDVSLSREEANDFLKYWMQTFGTRHAARQG